MVRSSQHIFVWLSYKRRMCGMPNTLLFEYFAIIYLTNDTRRSTFVFYTKNNFSL